MPPRLALRGHPPRQAAVAMAALRRKHFDHLIDTAQRRQSAPVATMTRLASRLAPAFFLRLPLGRCSPANPSEEGGFEDVVEFCRRNASFRSSSKIFLSRSISSCRSLSTSRLRRSFSRSSCFGFTGSSWRGWRCVALKHIHCQVFQAISRSKPKILKDFCDATSTGPELLHRYRYHRHSDTRRYPPSSRVWARCS